MKHKEQILKLRDEGKTYDEIKEILGCAKSTISYHCGEGQQKRRNKHPYVRKLDKFKDKTKTRQYKNQSIKNDLLIYSKLYKFGGENMNSMSFDFNDVVNKFGNEPRCYLTGKVININEPRTYQFDHKIPRAQGGENTLDNLGICTKEANFAKRDMTPQQFIELCKSVLEYQGYNVTKSNTD